MGFQQGFVDPCLFFRKEVVIVVYVGDCLIFTPKKECADELVKELADKFTIEDEGNISGYLGINITCPTADTIKMNQPALIQRMEEWFKECGYSVTKLVKMAQDKGLLDKKAVRGKKQSLR